MKRIKFTRTELYESEGRNKGPTYKEGSTHDFEDAFADRWIRRGAAVEVNTREPLPEDGPRADKPEDSDLEARINAYELAYRMQSAAPDAVSLASESEARSRSTSSTAFARSACASVGR